MLLDLYLTFIFFFSPKPTQGQNLMHISYSVAPKNETFYLTQTLEKDRGLRESTQ